MNFLGKITIAALMLSTVGASAARAQSRAERLAAYDRLRAQSFPSTEGVPCEAELQRRWPAVFPAHSREGHVAGMLLCSTSGGVPLTHPNLDRCITEIGRSQNSVCGDSANLAGFIHPDHDACVQWVRASTPGPSVALRESQCLLPTVLRQFRNEALRTCTLDFHGDGYGSVLQVCADAVAAGRYSHSWVAACQLHFSLDGNRIGDLPPNVVCYQIGLSPEGYARDEGSAPNIFNYRSNTRAGRDAEARRWAAISACAAGSDSGGLSRLYACLNPDAGEDAAVDASPAESAE